MVDKITFDYHDLWTLEGCHRSQLRKGEASLPFKDGVLTDVEYYQYEIRASAEAVIRLGFESECFDLDEESLHRLHWNEIPLEDACILQGMSELQFGSLSYFLKSKAPLHYTPLFKDTAEFWKTQNLLIRKFEIDKLDILQEEGDVLAKICNTILLLMGTKQYFQLKRHYKAVSILDFFDLAKAALRSEYSEDVIDFLRGFPEKPRCVTMLLDTLET